MSDTKTVVKLLNDALFESNSAEHDYFWFLEYVETPIGDYIKYYGQVIWDSENDYREWIAEDKQEDLKTYLVKEVGKVSKILSGQHKCLSKIK